MERKKSFYSFILEKILYEVWITAVKEALQSYVAKRKEELGKDEPMLEPVPA